MAIVDLRKKFIGFYDSMGSNNYNCLHVSINLNFLLRNLLLKRKQSNYDILYLIFRVSKHIWKMKIQKKKGILIWKC